MQQSPALRNFSRGDRAAGLETPLRKLANCKKTLNIAMPSQCSRKVNVWNNASKVAIIPWEQVSEESLQEEPTTIPTAMTSCLYIPY
jgi:hypothetical protein